MDRTPTRATAAPDAAPDAACDACLRSAWLRARLAAHIEPLRGRLELVLALEDEPLLEALGGGAEPAIRSELAAFSPGAARARAHAAGVELVCRCGAGYPAALRRLPAPPAVLHVRGGTARLRELIDRDPVAVVGSRRPSAYGLEVARALGRGLAAAGVCVVSGMAHGVDAAAHAGALEVLDPQAGATVAVLAAAVERAYPPANRPLYRRILQAGVAVSELPPRTATWRWMFPARNRLIAALCRLTIVVEATARSGSLLTARIAEGLGREVGAVPGRVTSPLAAGPNGLLAAGAHLIRGPQDALDVLFGAGARPAPASLARPRLEPSLERLRGALAAGEEAGAAAARLGLDAAGTLAALGQLELFGYVRRGAGGRYEVTGMGG